MLSVSMNNPEKIGKIVSRMSPTYFYWYDILFTWSSASSCLRVCQGILLWFLPYNNWLKGRKCAGHSQPVGSLQCGRREAPQCRSSGHGNQFRRDESAPTQCCKSLWIRSSKNGCWQARVGGAKCADLEEGIKFQTAAHYYDCNTT